VKIVPWKSKPRHFFNCFLCFNLDASFSTKTLNGDAGAVTPSLVDDLSPNIDEYIFLINLADCQSVSWILN
jgi:hypothetical protein